MRGIGLLNDLGVDSWSTHMSGGITFRTLCRDAANSTSVVWSEDLDKLFFKLNSGDNQIAWKHATFQQQEACRKSGKSGDACDTENKHILFDSTGGTMERSRGFISNPQAPTQTGKYYCAVFALQPAALTQYNAALKNKKGNISVAGSNGNDIAGTLGLSKSSTSGIKYGIDWTAKFFPVHVVEPFKLPKTGGEDCVNWNMLMSVVCVLGTGAMAAGFFLDQTKWGRAMLEALLRKTLIKDFICKTAKKLRALRRRSERWRC